MMAGVTKDAVYKLTHELIDEFCGRDAPNPDEYVPKFWSNLTDFDTFSNCVKKLIEIGFDNKHSIENEMIAQLAEAHRKVVSESIELRRSEIRNETINRAILSSHLYLLKDFDWQTKMILSSDQLYQINEPLVNLDLLLQAKLPNNCKTISIEMNKSELTKLISVLENAYNNLK